MFHHHTPPKLPQNLEDFRTAFIDLLVKYIGEDEHLCNSKICRESSNVVTITINRTWRFQVYITDTVMLHFLIVDIPNTYLYIISPYYEYDIVDPHCIEQIVNRLKYIKKACKWYLKIRKQKKKQ